MMPEQKPGRSKQDYPTPDDFMEAFTRRFDAPDWDLAATEENAKAAFFFTPEQNSLVQKWEECAGSLFLNPPFGKIGPWAKKAAETSIIEPTSRIFMLVPASIGSDWYRIFVEPFAYVLALTPRLSFDGKSPYPKDVILCAYIHGLTGFRTWRWK